MIVSAMKFKMFWHLSCNAEKVKGKHKCKGLEQERQVLRK